MKNNKHIGSSFENFLKEDGILEEVSAAASEAVIAHSLKKHKEKDDASTQPSPTCSSKLVDQ